MVVFFVLEVLILYRGYLDVENMYRVILIFIFKRIK